MTHPSDLARPPRRPHLELVDEALPGSAWRGHFAALWPAYRRWFLSRQQREPPSLAASRVRLARQMPEMASLWNRLRLLAAEVDPGELAARFLTLYRPPPFLTGCSLLATEDAATGEPILVRNYDYDPQLWEATLWRTEWGARRVVWMSDCLWGALDGINEAGFAVALAFGGRRVVGDGFGIPLIVRWLLETCTSVDEARNALGRVGSHMSYNLLMVDEAGGHLAAELSPDRPVRFSDRRVVTNHQAAGGDWPAYERATATRERAAHLERCLALGPVDRPRDAFLREPLHVTDVERSFATLYTAVLRPAGRCVELHWPEHSLVVATDGQPEPAPVSSDRPAG